MPSAEAMEDLQSEADTMKREQSRQREDFRSAISSIADSTKNILGAQDERLNAIEDRNLELQRKVEAQANDIQELRAQQLGLERETKTKTDNDNQKLAHLMGLCTSLLQSQPTPQTMEGPGDGGQLNVTENPETETMLVPLLHKMDFRNPQHLKALKEMENYQISLAIFHRKEKQDNDPVAYSVRRSQPFQNYLVCGERKNQNRVAHFWRQQEWANFPTVIELHGFRRDSITTPAFPKYVWEIGEIYNRRMEAITNQWTERSTGYHLVMDITSPSKAIWMVYRYAEDSDGVKISRNVTKPEKEQRRLSSWRPFTSLTGQSFDAAQVYSTVMNWHDEKTAMGQFRKSCTLVKETGRSMHPTPTFIEPVLEEVKKEIEQGWRKR
ncbi:uncharacterized protein JN550_005651 [Neoarthrinium moseri]|uniref:uncharacterized protein n=1 Tax=Neoarthrinium moseri TaxID=1658444 RepID=UPI001FDB59AC|nr:uncharacterized protein JN550_005651 [Neoarthrinium moseri]KAI1869670.1 hypothetical protein JN550_005651 [Neoarthrinium moseri]